MPLNLYSSAELMEATRTLIPEEYFLSQRYFGVHRTSGADEIVFDEMLGSNVMAPFVSPLVDGKPVVSKGYNSKSFKPAYIKLEDPITPTDLTYRQFGEEINAPDTADSRLNNGRMNAMDTQVAAIRRRIEWMCAQYMLLGKYTVSGEAYPASLLDFGADAALRYSLAGAALWSATGTATPLDDIDTAAQLMMDKAGVAPTEILFTGGGVWGYLNKNAAFRDFYKNFQPVGGPLPKITPQAAAKVQRKGQLGDYELMTYSDTYHDAVTNALVKYLPDGYMVLVAQREGGLDGRQLFGGIQNLKAIQEGAKKNEIYQYEWAKGNGSALMIGAESAPLVAARKPNAIVVVKVL
jgi:hypothetical protein